MCLLPRLGHHWSVEDCRYDITLDWQFSNGAGVRIKFRVGDEYGEMYAREPGSLPVYDRKPVWFKLDEAIPQSMQALFAKVAAMEPVGVASC
jgi:hypothetical protein